MGVKLKDIVEPKKIDFKDLEGRAVSIDAFNTLYQFLSTIRQRDGRPLTDYDRSFLRSNIAMVLQDTHLFTGTVRENIRYGRLDATNEEIENAAKLANAHSFISRLPEGYDTMITGDGANLSQGQRQLLAIARAAVADPPVLILDEATSSLDNESEYIVQEFCSHIGFAVPSLGIGALYLWNEHP